MPTFNNGETGLSIRDKLNEAINKVDGELTIDSIDVSGGTLDGVTIGANTPGAASFTEVSASGDFSVSGNTTLDGAVTANTLSVSGETIVSSNVSITGSITVTGTVDGRDLASDGTKLDGIETGAEVNPTASEIKVSYESNANTNVFSDADKTKLDSLEDGAEVNPTASEIKTSYESNDDTNAFTDAEKAKLSNIEPEADITDSLNVELAGALMSINNLSDVANNDLALSNLGFTATITELNSLSGVTYDLTNLNGLTTSADDLNYVSGVSSSIQTQLDNRVTSNTDDNLTGGYTTSVVDDGSFSSGTYTPDPSGGNMRKITCAGNFAIAAPTASGDFTMVIQITNVSGVGSIDMTGFDVVTGDAFIPTVGRNYFVFITKCNGFTSANVQEL